MSYEQQREVAKRLDALIRRIVQHACQIHAYVEDMRRMARAQRRDFYTLVVADVLGIDYYEVTALERWAAKAGLFAFLYSGKVTRIQDSIIIERGSAR